MKKRLFAVLLAGLFSLLSACTLLPETTPPGKDTPFSISQSAASGASSAPSSPSASAPTGSSEPGKTTVDLLAESVYTGEPYVVVNDNVPTFTAKEKTTKAYETYGKLDRLGRCRAAMACLGKELMPTEKRGAIGSVKPTGWQTAKYDFVDGKYLYNRCHLIGYQLSGENANRRNLITGTRYLNVEGMLPFENMTADYIHETGNHVLYRVTPIFFGDNLVASGVQMEAFSVEDDGDGICFHVYCYNVQPGVTIDYATGENTLAK